MKPLLFLTSLLVCSLAYAETVVEVIPSTTTLDGSDVRGIHLTASAAGSKRYRANHLEPMFAGTIINCVIIDIKEEDGFVYVPGVKMAEQAKAYARDIPDLEAWLAELKRRNIYTIARLVAFKDNKAPRHFPKLGVRKTDGTLWEDRKKMTWLDPYNQQAWEYDFAVAAQAAKLGFDEIQFDYIRFPTDGDLKSMRFIKPYSSDAAAQALSFFLHKAAAILHPLGAKVSIDVFGLTTSVDSGMGIGQKMTMMAKEVDYVCPMTYPSHYAKGEYGIAVPNDQPYKVISYAMRDAIRALGPASVHKLRPYLQDFSLKGRGIRYGAKEVRDQIQAAADAGIMSWSLWNARASYTVEALRNPVVPRAATPAPAASSGTVSAVSSVEVSSPSK